MAINMNDTQLSNASDVIDVSIRRQLRNANSSVHKLFTSLKKNITVISETSNMSHNESTDRKLSTDSTKSFKLAEEQFQSVSVLRYFTSELTRGYLLEREQEKYAQKRQRVYTFMKTPRELEKFSIYGFFQCVDAFLFIFTFLPLRILLAVLKMFTLPCGLMRSHSILEPAQICDILKGVILVVCSFIMSYIDTSMMYHLIRGQATIKLYVFFNMLDMADRLLSNFGHDILDALFWTATEPRGKKREHIGTVPHLAIAIIYVILHTLLILFQATVLNVAFNSHNKSLLVIMMSNNFVEIKSNLFKKVDVNHLYQIACSDVKERFHYVLLLSVVCIRNMTEVSWELDHLWNVLLPDAIMVLMSEVFVDWGKHAFILKFNEIPADAYREFKVKLALDMASSRQSQAFTDHSDLVSRRMGLTPLPLACLLYRILSKSVKITTWLGYVILFVLFLCLITFKVLNSIVLLGHSYKHIQKYHEAKQQSDSPNEEGPPAESTNHNKSPADSSASSSFSDSTHDRRASYDSTKVSRNISEIFTADSYTELTMLPDTHVIEQSGGITLTDFPKTKTNLKSDLPCDEISTKSHVEYQRSQDMNSKSHDHDQKSHDTLKSSEYMPKAASYAASELHTTVLQQRSQKGYFVNIGPTNRRKFGSSASLPETIGIPECVENGEESPENEHGKKT